MPESASPKNNLITCLIAGGAGFIGSYVCERLLDQNCFVYCVDNFSTGRHQNIQPFLNNPRFKLIEHDLGVTTPFKLDHQLDYVFHLAGIEAYMNGLDVDLDTLLVNSFGTKALLELAREHQAKFLLGSAEAVYHPFHPGDQFNSYFGDGRPNRGSQIFIEAKRFSESLTVEYAKEKQIDARIVRLAFLYGPRMNLASGALLAKMLYQAVKHETVALPNDGMTIVYPTFIEDAIYGLIKAMFSQSSKNKIYGLVHSQPLTLLNVAHHLEVALGKRLTIRFYPTDLDLYNGALSPLVVKSQEALGWYPRQDLTQGLQKTVAWLQTQNFKTEPGLETKTSLVKPSSPPPQTVVPPITPVLPQQVEVIPMIKPRPVPTTPLPNKPEPLPPLIVPPSVVQSKLPERLKHLWSRDKKSSRHSVKPWVLGSLTVGLVFGLLALLPSLAVTVLARQSLALYTQAQAAANQAEWDQTQKLLSQATQRFQGIQTIYPLLAWQQAWLGVELPQPVPVYVEYGEPLLLIARNLNRVAADFEQLMAIFLNRETADPVTLVADMDKHLNQAAEELAQLEVALTPSQAESLSVDLRALQDLIQAGQRFTQIAPDLLAFDKKQTLLVLLQDDQELRPSGGFLEGTALVSVEKGRLLDVTIQNVGSIDRQLKGQIKPPEPIETYLGETSWKLRDANFAPDFPEAAARSAWFVQKGLGVTVDGVIGVNYRVLEALLKASGDVYVPEYKETISETNLRPRALSHAQIAFTDKENSTLTFLPALAQSLYLKYKEAPESTWTKTVPYLHDRLDAKDLLVWLPDTGASRFLQEWGWDGAIRTPPTQLVEFGEIQTTDYLAVYEANLGVNKVNGQIKRDLAHVVEIDTNGAVTAKTSLTWQNHSKSEAWPEGRYKTFVRTYLPKGAQVQTVWVRDPAQPERDKKLEGDELTLDGEYDKRRLGVYLEVPSASQHQLEITYTLNTSLSTEGGTYALYFQKQPGMAESTLSLTLQYPPAWHPTKLSQKGTVGEGELSFKHLIQTDQVFAVSFSQ